MKNLATTALNNAIELLHKAMPELLAVYRFGSAGTEYERSSSDVDLAFLSYGFGEGQAQGCQNKPESRQAED